MTFDAPDDAVPTDHVIGFDVLLTDISTFTIGLRPSPNGIAFVMTQQGEVVGLPRDGRFADLEVRKEAILSSPQELGIDAVRDGTIAYWEHPVAQREAYRFVSGGESWWAGARSFARPRLTRASHGVSAVVTDDRILGGIVRFLAFGSMLTFSTCGDGSRCGPAA